MSLLTEEKINTLISQSEVYQYHPGAILEFARAIEKAVLAEVAGKGYRLVPVEPTREMIDAYLAADVRFPSARSDWAAMLAAAPSLPEVGE